MLTRADCWAGAGGDGGGPSDGVRTGHGDHRCWMQTVAGVRSSVKYQGLTERESFISLEFKYKSYE